MSDSTAGNAVLAAGAAPSTPQGATTEVAPASATVLVSNDSNGGAAATSGGDDRGSGGAGGGGGGGGGGGNADDDEDEGFDPLDLDTPIKYRYPQTVEGKLRECMRLKSIANARFGAGMFWPAIRTYARAVAYVKGLAEDNPLNTQMAQMLGGGAQRRLAQAQEGVRLGEGWVSDSTSTSRAPRLS
jgi:hypothetical protein